MLIDLCFFVFFFFGFRFIWDVLELRVLDFFIDSIDGEDEV